MRQTPPMRGIFIRAIICYEAARLLPVGQCAFAARLFRPCLPAGRQAGSIRLLAPAVARWAMRLRGATVARRAMRRAWAPYCLRQYGLWLGYFAAGLRQAPQYAFAAPAIARRAIRLRGAAVSPLPACLPAGRRAQYAAREPAHGAGSELRRRQGASPACAFAGRFASRRCPDARRAPLFSRSQNEAVVL